VASYLHLVRSARASTAWPAIAAQAARDTSPLTVVLLDDTGPPALPPGVAVRRLAPGDLDHAELLDLVFAADHVITW
jgi:hypothetical protein